MLNKYLLAHTRPALMKYAKRLAARHTNMPLWKMHSLCCWGGKTFPLWQMQPHFLSSSFHQQPATRMATNPVRQPPAFFDCSESFCLVWPAFFVAKTSMPLFQLGGCFPKSEAFCQLNYPRIIFCSVFIKKSMASLISKESKRSMLLMREWHISVTNVTQVFCRLTLLRQDGGNRDVLKLGGCCVCGQTATLAPAAFVWSHTNSSRCWASWVIGFRIMLFTCVSNSLCMDFQTGFLSTWISLVCIETD